MIVPISQSFDANTMKYFYHNDFTDKTVWAEPKNYVAPSKEKKKKPKKKSKKSKKIKKSKSKMNESTTKIVPLDKDDDNDY